MEKKTIGFIEVPVDSQIPSVDIYKAVLDGRRRVSTVEERIYLHEAHKEYLDTFTKEDLERLKAFKNQTKR